jgi:formate hydrogenlyase transcriptional activator
VTDVIHLRNRLERTRGFCGIVGRHPSMQRVFDAVRELADVNVPILIQGESGTGKELVANALHGLSRRAAGPLVPVNCGALPEGTLESELFGHVKGAFTGSAGARAGLFREANHGTIFLDEIGEAPLELQPKLLRVLQEHEFERLGNSHTLRTDARLVAATNVELLQMVASKKFRADLFYRLNVFPIQVPALRERSEDIPVLVRHFALDAARRTNRKVSWIASTAMDALIAYAWPGNIRELQNFVERSVIRSAGDELRMPISELDQGISVSDRPAARGTLEDAERAHILAALQDTGWTLSGPRGAATRLGIHRSTLQFRMKKLGIERPPMADGHVPAD